MCIKKITLILPAFALLPFVVSQPDVVSSGAVPQTYTVDSDADTGDPDDTPDGLCPSPCTLREAIFESNASEGVHDTIVFNLAVGTINVPAGDYVITDSVTVDGTNQNAASPGRVELVGDGTSDAIVIVGGTGSIIRDLVISQFAHGIVIDGDDIEDPSTTGNTIAGCRIGTDKGGVNASSNIWGISLFDTSGNTIGGTSAADRNLVSGNISRGIELLSSAFNVIRGNRIGTNAAGTAAIPNGDFSFEDGGIQLFGSSDNIIGGRSANARNLISGNFLVGVGLHNGDRNRIEGNYIGVDVSGTGALPNVLDGIFVNSQSSRNTIGGTVSGARNVISGHDFEGIEVNGDRNVIQGNFLGTNATGSAAIPNFNGIVLSGSAALNTVGGPSPGARNVASGNSDDGILSDGSRNTIQGNYIGVAADGTSPLGNAFEGVDLGEASGNVDVLGNIIAHNGHDGVEVEFNASNDGNAILGNSIFGNGRRGIDLEPIGVNPNDPDDIDDSQPNNGQNFPFILRAVSAAKAITIDGSLNSTPSSTFRIEFFASPHCDNSGHGEGQNFLGATEVTTNSGGDVVFSVTLLQVVAAGQDVTATATSPGDDTSEFSACHNVVASALTCQGMPADIAGTISDNNLTGTNGNDVIAASSGDDTISALGGDDRVCAGTGDDTAHGGDGLDRLNGESGDDTLNGNAGDDVLNGGGDTDSCNGGGGAGDTATNCETTTGLP